jgi:hypothetical protein
MSFCIANWNYAGTQKFISHKLKDDEETTLCGLKWSKLRGDWQIFYYPYPSCKKCSCKPADDVTNNETNVTNVILN